MTDTDLTPAEAIYNSGLRRADRDVDRERQARGDSRMANWADATHRQASTSARDVDRTEDQRIWWAGYADGILRRARAFGRPS